MALVLLRERSLGDDSAWAPYIAQLPAGYDLLGCWTDDQLEELQCERLQDAARAQRAENNAAFDAVRMNVSAYDSDYDLGLGALTKEDVVWGLNTVRSRSYRAKYPSSCGVLPPLSNLEGKTLDAAALLTKSARQRSGEKSESANKESVFMLPFLDALNHRDNKGSGGATKLVFMSPLEDDAAERGAKGTFELRSPAAVEKDAEAVVCYGDKNNEELLLRYGFCVENGVHDEITLPGCMDELEWVMPGSARESDLKAERLDEAVKRARLNDEGKASVNLLWALRVLLASDATYEAAGGAKGLMRASLPGEDGGEAADAAEDGGAFYLTLVPIRPRRRRERRSLRTLPGASLRPHPAFNTRPRRLSTSPDAFELHPDVRSYRTARRGRCDGGATRGGGFARARVRTRTREDGRAGRARGGRDQLRGGVESVRADRDRVRGGRGGVRHPGRGGVSQARSGHRAGPRTTAFALYVTPVPIRPRSRGARRSLKTFSPGVSLRPSLDGFNPDMPRRLSTPLLTPFNSTPTSL